MTDCCATDGGAPTKTSSAPMTHRRRMALPPDWPLNRDSRAASLQRFNVSTYSARLPFSRFHVAPEVGRADRGILSQRGRRSMPHDPAGLHDVRAGGEAQHGLGVLLHDQDALPLVLDLGESAQNVADDQRSEPQ